MKHLKNEDKGEEKELKVLGIIWKVDEDKLYRAKVKDVIDTVPITKRLMLKVICGIYDPLGMISPLLIEPKMLMRDLWRRKLGWDDNILDDIVVRWRKWINDIGDFNKIGWKRCINQIEERERESPIYELFTFTDASKLAYGAVVYLKVRHKETNTGNLIFAKNRIAPLNNISIPRLELLGVLIGCRISNYVANQLNISELKQTIFTDSMCSLEWCKSQKELKRFVLDKVKEIRSYNVRIGYVKSEENPADITSRGSTTGKLMNNKLWWEGPSCLQRNSEILEETYEVNKDIQNAVINEEKGSKILHEAGLISGGIDLLTGPFNIIEESISSYN